MQHVFTNESESSKGRTTFLLLLLCFYASGLAGLVYQSAWSVEFSLVFGTSELAIATVLAAYMGGLACGAAIAGKFAARIINPVRVYALLELGIAVTALLVPYAIDIASGLQVQLFGSPNLGDADHLGLLAFDLVASFLILIVPTALMGATLPLLARHVVRKDREIGSHVGLLYTANTLGAACGALAAAYWFLPRWGLGVTVWLAVAANGLVFVAAMVLARKMPNWPTESRVSQIKRKGDLPILAFMAVFGAISFTLEILWTRLLGQVLGGTVYAFGIMLTTFLLGIAIGSAIAGRLAVTASKSLGWFGLCQLGVGGSTLLAFLFADQLPAWGQALGSDFGSLLWVGSLLCMATLMPAAIFSGATFPLAVRMVAQTAADSGPASARVFAWNTCGAILGAIGAGYLLIPALGFPGTIGLVVTGSGLLALLALGWWLRENASQSPRPIWNYAVGLVMVGVVVVMLVLQFKALPQPWNLLRASALNRLPIATPVRYFEVGRSATVMVSDRHEDWRLATNGLPESIIQGPDSRPGQLPIARWLSLLPLAARPDVEQMLVVGFGAGVTVEQVPQTVRSIQVVELEPAVIRANQAFAEKRLLNPLADPRLSIHINDARSALLLSQTKYDAIVSQPSHPWTSAASHLFTKEFFEVVAEKLQSDGVFVQWIGLRFVDDALLTTLVATLNAVFPHVEVFSPGQGAAVLFLASNRPLISSDSLTRALQQAPAAWSEIGVRVPEDILLTRILDSEGSRELASLAPISTDRRNLLKIGSPKLIYSAHTQPNLDSLSEGREPLSNGLDDQQRMYIMSQLLQQQHLTRARRLVYQMKDPLNQKIGLGLVALASNQPSLAGQLLSQAQRQKPHDPWIEHGLIGLFKQRILQGNVPINIDTQLSPTGQTMVAAIRADHLRDWQHLAALEHSLADIGVKEPWFQAATRLRIAWRIWQGQPPQHEEAKTLLKQGRPTPFSAKDLLLAFQLGMVSRDRPLVKRSLAEMRHRTRQHPGGPRWFKPFLQALRTSMTTLNPEQGAWIEREFPQLFADLDMVGRTEAPDQSSVPKR